MPGQSGYAAGWGALALINAGLAQGGVQARPLGHSEWAAVGVILAVLVTLVVGLMAAGLPAQVVGG